LHELGGKKNDTELQIDAYEDDLAKFVEGQVKGTKIFNILQFSKGNLTKFFNKFYQCYYIEPSYSSHLSQKHLIEDLLNESEKKLTEAKINLLLRIQKILEEGNKFSK